MTRHYRWFLRPLDELTNKAFGYNLDTLTSVTEIRIRTKGGPSNIEVWEASRNWLKFFNNSRRSGGNLNFEIYTKADGETYARKWDFESPNKMRRRRNRIKKQAMKASSLRG